MGTTFWKLLFRYNLYRNFLRDSHEYLWIERLIQNWIGELNWSKWYVRIKHVFHGFLVLVYAFEECIFEYASERMNWNEVQSSSISPLSCYWLFELLVLSLSWSWSWDDNWQWQSTTTRNTRWSTSSACSTWEGFENVLQQLLLLLQ